MEIELILDYFHTLRAVSNTIKALPTLLTTVLWNKNTFLRLLFILLPIFVYETFFVIFVYTGDLDCVCFLLSIYLVREEP